MARSLDEIKDDIKNRLSIVDVVSSRIQLKRAGGTYKACCPFHKEKTPSFTVNPSNGFYKCFGCGESGDIFTFLMKNDGMSFMDALRTLAERAGVVVDIAGSADGGVAAKRLLSLHTEMAEFYRKCLLTMKSAEVARKYLKSRDLPERICEEFAIGYAPEKPGILEKFAAKNKYTLDEMIRGGFGLAPSDDRSRRDGANLYDRFKNRLMFPIRDTQGRVIAFSGRLLESDAKAAKYVNSPETEIFKKSATLFALDKAQRHITRHPHREALICEGQIDVIRCHACGFQRAVASQGTAFTEEHARILSRYADSAILVFDQDGAGQKAAVKTGALLSSCGFPVRVARMPEGEDPDSFLRKNPPESFQKLLDESADIVPFQVRYFQTTENDPNSEGAVGRIASQALETIYGAKNQIHKARMLQQLSDLIGIPAEALQAELKRIEEKERERAQRSYPETTVKPVAEVYFPNENDNPNETTLRKPAKTRTSDKVGKVVDPLDLTLCELAIHSFAEDAETVEFAAKHIPEVLITNLLCRKIYNACLNDSDNAFSVLQNSDRDAAQIIGAIATAKCKTTGRESFTTANAVRELALRLWRRHCLAQIEVADSAEQRLSWRITAKKLDAWETGASVITELSKSPISEIKTIAPAPAPVKPIGIDAGETESVTVQELTSEYIPDFGDDYSETE